MSYLNWHVGMKVVCIKQGAWRKIAGPDYHGCFPFYGKVYTIDELIPDFNETEGLYVGIVGFNPAFSAQHFRPVQPRRPDISIFTRMLNPQKQEERA